MRTAVTVMSLFGSFAIFCSVTNLIGTVVMFLLFGIIPGRPQPVSADLMLTSYVTLAALLVAQQCYAYRGTIIRNLATIRQALAIWLRPIVAALQAKTARQQ